MKNIFICLVLAVVVFFATSKWVVAAQTIAINATVPTVTGGLSVVVSKVIGTTFSPASSLSFGTLALDPVNNIYTTADQSYYAVDVGVVDNTATIWTVTHTRASMISGANNLDNKVNVSFVKQTSSTVSSPLQKVSFNNSQSIAYDRTALAGGWLRIYYGLGTGDPANPDATGVTPIGLDTPAGTYSGSVTITLTP
ncbi:MAG: hypothetical protein PHC71_06770 [Candidatus Omnitrophica bacterium]|nr:hypothetical protein [Candidatus Omnitrophota bacterium]